MTHRRRHLPTPRLARLSLAAAAAAALCGCGLSDPEPFDPARLRAAELRADGDATAFRRLDAPGQPPVDRRGFLDVDRLTEAALARGATVETGELDPAADGDEEAGRVPMPLQEAVRRAAIGNYDVRVSAYDPAIANTRIIEANARFDPVFQAQVEFQYSDRQIADQLVSTGDFLNPVATITGEEQTIYTGQASLIQPLTSGGQAELRYQAQVADLPTNLLRGTAFNPAYESDLTLRFTQPLLRDFGRGVNRARIVINQNDRQIGVLDFRRDLEQSLLDTEQAYWLLYAAQREQEIQRELLGRTLETLEDIRARLGNDANAGQVAQALGTVEERRLALLRAESQVRELSDRLKLLMNDPDLPILGDAVVVAATEPVRAPLRFDLVESARAAAVFRPEVAQQLIRVRSAGTALEVGRNNVLPRLDVVLSGGVQGLSDDFGDAVANQVEFGNLSAGAGLQFEVPLGNQAARGVYQRANLQREQAVTAYLAAVRQVAAEVKQAMRDVSTSYAELAILRRSVEASAEAARVVEVEAANQPLSPQLSDLKLRFLSELADARSREARAVADYNFNLAALERAKGTLLRYNNIVIAAEPSPPPQIGLP